MMLNLNIEAVHMIMSALGHMSRSLEDAGRPSADVLSLLDELRAQSVTAGTPVSGGLSRYEASSGPA